MTFNTAKSIVNFGGTLWWVFIRFCRTKLSDEHKKEKSVRNFIFLFIIFYFLVFVTIKITAPNPIFVVDGIIVSKAEFDTYKPNEIESVKVFNEENAKVIYGVNGNNGAVILTLKHNRKQ